jgi:hypothetical protein
MKAIIIIIVINIIANQQNKEETTKIVSLHFCGLVVNKAKKAQDLLFYI